MKKIIIIGCALLTFISCSKNEKIADAYGNFEVNDVIISSQASGEILEFNINEGEDLELNQVVGQIDTTILSLKKAQLTDNIAAMAAKIESANLNMQAMNRQFQLLKKEKNRIVDLYAKEAATEQKQDKILAEYDATELKIKALKKEIESLEKQKNGSENNLKEIEENLDNAKIINPVKGVVLVKYKEAHELVSAGTPLYKIGNLKEMYLKVYVSADQLDDVEIGQQAEVLIDNDKNSYHKLSGKISWISSSAEFTPKNIQTKEERIDQVYAVKIHVKNDGMIKIGMPGEVYFK